MLGGKNTLLEAVGIVSGQDWYLRLCKHVTGIQFLGDDMN